MYGHHNQHSTPYNSNSGEPNYYNYSGELNSSSHHQFQNYYSSNYHYEEPYLYASAPSDTVEAPSSPHNVSYYAQHLQETPIVNTDTGLTYTNLDYSNSTSNYSQNNYNENFPRGHSTDLLHHNDNSEDAQIQQNYLHDNKFQLDINDSNYLINPNAASTSACMEFQHLHRYKQEMMPEEHSRLRQHHGLHTLTSSSMQQPALPTYKWMQVKRNVPKPPGEYKYC